MFISFPQKCCANCEYLVGPRQKDAFSKYAVVKDSSCVPGVCTYSNMRRPANYSACTKYIKWALLH